jgi:hypothetical protein
MKYSEKVRTTKHHQLEQALLQPVEYFPDEHETQ